MAFLVMGKLRFLSIVLFLCFKLVNSQDLADYQWNNRLLILVAEKDNAIAAKKLKTFANFKKEFGERDLLLLERSVHDNELIALYGISARFEGILLIGKDGGLKLKKPYSIEIEDIFKLIDSMPMRRVEMKKS